jgi:hypothetical protein
MQYIKFAFQYNIKKVLKYYESKLMPKEYQGLHCGQGGFGGFGTDSNVIQIDDLGLLEKLSIAERFKMKTVSAAIVKQIIEKGIYSSISENEINTHLAYCSKEVNKKLYMEIRKIQKKQFDELEQCANRIFKFT